MGNLYHYTTIWAKDGSPILTSLLSPERSEINFRATYYKKFGTEDYQWIRKDSIPIVKALCEENGETYDPDETTLMPYVISFCQTPNSAFMWEKYGGKRKGIMLEFDKIEIEKALCPINAQNNVEPLDCLIPCLYVKEKSEENLKVLISNYMKRVKYPECYSYFDKIKFAFVAMKKKDEYEKEDECRYIRLCTTSFCADSNGGNYFFTDHYVKEKDWHQYFIFPRETLKSITVGRDASTEDFNFVREYAIKCGLSPRNVKNEK